MNDNTLTTSLIPQSQNILETEQIVSDTTSPSSATQIQEISVESNIIANFSHEDSYVQTKIVINVQKQGNYTNQPNVPGSLALYKSLGIEDDNNEKKQANEKEAPLVHDTLKAILENHIDEDVQDGILLLFSLLFQLSILLMKTMTYDLCFMTT